MKSFSTSTSRRSVGGSLIIEVAVKALDLIRRRQHHFRYSVYLGEIVPSPLAHDNSNSIIVPSFQSWFRPIAKSLGAFGDSGEHSANN
jgi:hypothetical protein